MYWWNVIKVFDHLNTLITINQLKNQLISHSITFLLCATALTYPSVGRAEWPCIARMYESACIWSGVEGMYVCMHRWFKWMDGWMNKRTYVRSFVHIMVEIGGCWWECGWLLFACLCLPACFALLGGWMRVSVVVLWYGLNRSCWIVGRQ